MGAQSKPEGEQPALTPAMQAWPRLPGYAEWRATAATFQLWTQIVGKVRLALSPWLNHGWQVPLYINAHGLGTSAIHTPRGVLEIDFDLVDHQLVVRTSELPDRRFALEPMSVAAFYRRLMKELAAARIDVQINVMPNEVAGPIRFPDDEVHSSYDAAAVATFWRALLQADRVFQLFRTSFLGKSSPVHFFWGSFDLAVTRFSGRAGTAASGRRAGLARSGHSRSLFARGEQRRLLARQRCLSAGSVLFIRLSHAGGLRTGQHRAVRGGLGFGPW